MKTFNIDLHRSQEKIDVFYRGDASRLHCLTRACFLAENADEIHSVIEWVENDDCGKDQKVVSVLNRFAVPADSGYRDLKVLLQDKDSGYTSMMRVIHLGFEKSTCIATAPITWQMRSTLSRRVLNLQEGHAPLVLVTDNFLRDDKDSCHAVYGFSSLDHAYCYAISRFKNNLESLLSISPTSQELINSWYAFGEDVAVVFGGEIDYLSKYLEAYIIELRIPEINHWKFEKLYDLKKTAIPTIDNG